MILTSKAGTGHDGIFF